MEGVERWLAPAGDAAAGAASKGHQKKNKKNHLCVCVSSNCAWSVDLAHNYVRPFLTCVLLHVQLQNAVEGTAGIIWWDEKKKYMELHNSLQHIDL